MTASSAPPVRPHRLRPPLLDAADVDRPRLTTAIRATPASGTCIISAPPGHGATTAVAQAVAGIPGVAWIGLDEFDTTPQHLWVQLTSALTTSSAAHPISVPTVADDAHVLATMAPLVERLEDADCQWIVLDGVDAEAHKSWSAALAYLIANLPPNVRLAITTHDAPRCIPADPADRRVMVIDREQLLATADEAARIALASGPHLDIDAVEEIAATAQGWIAAIRSAARYAALHPGDNAGHWLMTQGARDLVDPWLNRLTVDGLTFLVDTAFLEQLAEPLCDAALATSGSLPLLEALGSRGSYLIELAPSPAGPHLRWWGRHPILTAALLQRPSSRDDSDRNMRAAHWFQERGDFESTMRHMLAAGRLDEAGQYLRAHENSLFVEGKADRAAAWYASLPPDSWGQLGWHLVRIAWGQAIGAAAESADTTLAQLRAHLASSPVEGVEQRVLQAETATLAAYLSVMAGDTTTAIASARSAIDLFCEESPANSQQIAPVALIRALLLDGDSGSARREIGRVKFQPFPTALIREVSLGSLSAQCLVDEGRIKQARREVSRAKKWLAGHGLTIVDVSQFSLITAEGASLLEGGDVDSAIAKLGESVDAALAGAAIGDASGALIWQARALTSSGQLGDALACLHQARQLLHESSPTSAILNRIDLAEAFVRNVGGDSVRAERLVQRVPASDARTLMWSRVTMHRQASGVRRSLASIDSDVPRIAIEKQVLLATIAMKRSNTLAEGHLVRAADLAGANDFNLALLGSPPELLDLAGTLASRMSHDSLAQLVHCAQPKDRQSLSDAAQAIANRSNAGPPLSPGELELIAFLPRRDTNAEIARQLGVSINTVKTRLYRMYRKLGVDSRDDAINAARARGLIT